MTIDTKLEKWLDSLPTANFRIFAGVVTTVIVSLAWGIGAMFDRAPDTAVMVTFFGFFLAWMGIETANHYLRRKTHDPTLETRENRERPEEDGR